MDILEYFQELERHDWYYNYSDDHTVWERGNRNAHRLQAIAAEDQLLGRMYADYSKWVFLDVSERERTNKPTAKSYLI